MARRAVVILFPSILALSVVGACGESSSAVPGVEPPGRATGTAKGTETPPPRGATTEAVTPLTEAAATALVDAWARSQNGGDFAAYERLYAPKFTGVKRVGTRRSTFDRAGWLRDRRRMFEKPMRMTATEQHVTATGTTAVIEFTQEWAQGTFRDVGRKRLVLIAGGAHPLIAREELLSSEVLGAGGPRALLFAPVTFVFTVGNTRLALVAKDPAAALGTGPVLEWSQGVPEYPGAAVTTKAMGEPHVYHGRYRGKPVRLHGDGKVCSGRLGEARAVRMFVPHFGEVDAWKALATKPDALAEHVWGAGAAGQFVAMTVTMEGCDVSNPRWGTLPGARATSPLSRMYPAEYEDSARRALGEHPLVTAAEEEQGLSGPWPKDELAVTVWGRGTERSHVVVQGTRGTGCGDWLSAFGVFTPDLTPLSVLVDGFTVTDLIDLDGDGSPEFIGRWWSDPAVGTLRNGTLVFEPLGVPYYDCDC